MGPSKAYRLKNWITHTPPLMICDLCLAHKHLIQGREWRRSNRETRSTAPSMADSIADRIVSQRAISEPVPIIESCGKVLLLRSGWSVKWKRVPLMGWVTLSRLSLSFEPIMMYRSQASGRLYSLESVYDLFGS